MEPAVRGAEGARLEGLTTASTASCHVRMAARMLSQKQGRRFLPPLQSCQHFPGQSLVDAKGQGTLGSVVCRSPAPAVRGGN